VPVRKPADLSKGGGGRWPHTGEGLRSERWGDLEVGYTNAGPLDCTPVYAGLPGGVCSCPPHGYVFSGRVRCVVPGTDRSEEVAEAGDAYYFPAGHVLIYDDPS